MTIDERADAAAIKFITDHTKIVIDSPPYRALVEAFKTIARDQRHACAEAVNKCKQGTFMAGGEKLIRLNEAHEAVMNA